VVLVDDNPEFMERVREFLDDFCIIGSFLNGSDLLDAWDELRPDVMILDISMSPLTGLQLAPKLAEQGYGGPIVFLTMHNDGDMVRAALAAGGSAYVLKSHMAHELVPALHAVLAGRRFLSASLPEAWPENLP